MAGSFKLFKDPSLVHFSGGTTLSGNQLRGIGGFDPSVTLQQQGPGFKILQNGKLIGATSGKNVFDSPGSHGFSLFSGSVAQNEQAGAGNTGTGIVTSPKEGSTKGTDPDIIFSGGSNEPLAPSPEDAAKATSGTVFTGPGVQDGPGPGGDTDTTGTNINAGLGNQALDAFVNQTFDPVRFGQIPGAAFSGLFSGGDAVAARLISGQPVGELELANWWQNTFLPRVQQMRASSENQVSIGGGGTFTLGGSAPGTQPNFSDLNIPRLTGADFGLPGVQSEVGDLIAGLQGSIAGLDFSGPQGQLTNLSRGVNELALPTSFTTSLDDVSRVLDTVTGGVDELGRSQVPANLLRSLQDSQGILEELAGGSFGGSGFGFPANAGLLGNATTQAQGLSDILGNLAEIPDLSNPLAQANQLNTTFAGLQGALNPTLQGLEAASGNVRGLRGDLNSLPNLQALLGSIGEASGGLQGLRGDITSLPNLQTLLGRIGEASGGVGALGEQIGGLRGALDPALQGLQTASGATRDLRGDLTSLPNLQALLGRLGEAQAGVGELGRGIGDLPDLPDIAGATGDLRGLRSGIQDLPGLPDIAGATGDLRGLRSGIRDLPGLPDTSQISDILGAIRAGEFDRIPTEILGGGPVQLPQNLLDLPRTIDAGFAGLNPQFANIIDELSKVRGGVTDLQGRPAGGGDVDLGPLLAAIEAMQQGSTTPATGATGTTAAPGTILADIEAALRPQIQAGRPETAEQLRQDPLTASILADLEERNRRREEQDRNMLGRLGVLRGGDTINLANQRADDIARQELAALADASQRLGGQFDTNVRSGLSLAGDLSAQELAEAGVTGNFRGGRTLSGQDQDLANLAALFPLLQSEFNPITTRDPGQIALVRALLPILPPDLQATMRQLLGE